MDAEGGVIIGLENVRSRCFTRVEGKGSKEYGGNLLFCVCDRRGFWTWVKNYQINCYDDEERF